MLLEEAKQKTLKFRNEACHELMKIIEESILEAAQNGQTSTRIDLKDVKKSHGVHVQKSLTCEGFYVEILWDRVRDALEFLAISWDPYTTSTSKD